MSDADKPRRRWPKIPATWWLGLALGVLTTAVLARGHHDVGYARDEGIYFDASRSYAAWVAEVGTSPSRATDRKLRDRHFAINHEHPVLMKIVAGVSARWLAAPPFDANRPDAPRPGMVEGAAMRLPAQILTGLGVTILFIVGAAFAGIGGGLLAAGSFILLPRVAFHAGLHAFDVPVAVATLVVALAYRAGLRHRGWALAAGPLLGIAIAIKHNALFIGPLVALHYYACLGWARWRHGKPITRGQWVPLPLLSMAIIGPLVAWALWPWMWSDTITRLVEYFDFHRQHSWYNMEFLGANYNQPPMPMAYPWVMTWATVPTAVLLGAVIGLLRQLRRDWTAGASERAATPRWSAPLPEGWARLDGLWLGVFALFPLVLISLPGTPIFGGTKHWLTAYPFFSLALAVAWRELWAHAGLGVKKRWLAPVVLGLCLAPAAIGTVRGHPYNLSQYAPLIGGARGAADVGLNRGFWGHATYGATATFETLPGPLYLHDLHELSRRQYEREGRWPQQLRPSPAGRAHSGLLFYEKHMAADELSLWQSMGTTVPLQVITLDDVPITSVYTRPTDDPHGR